MKEMTRKEVQQVSLDILKDVHEFCVENNIHYSLSGGTLLGAIRHNGFIPWDDDIDIQLPRPEFDKLVNTYKSDKGYKIFYHELEGCEKMSYCNARVCDMKKTFVDSGILPWNTHESGIWIDILPCDGMPGDMICAKVYLKHMYNMVRKAYWYGIKQSKWSNIYKGVNITAKLKFLLKKIFAYSILHNPVRSIIKERRKYDYTTSEYFFCTPHYGMGEWQPKKNMGSYILHKFEDTEFYVMSGYDDNLHSLYGDYMKLPPENKRVSHDYNKYYWR